MSGDTRSIAAASETVNNLLIGDRQQWKIARGGSSPKHLLDVVHADEKVEAAEIAM